MPEDHLDVFGAANGALLESQMGPFWKIHGAQLDVCKSAASAGAQQKRRILAGGIRYIGISRLVLD